MISALRSAPFVIVLLLGCSDEPEKLATSVLRPVSVASLTSGPPPGRVLFPGVVAPYRETQVSFEVEGRVVELLNVGDDVDGEELDRRGETIRKGSVIARIDPAPFERAVTKAERRLDSARADLDALNVQLESVLPAQLKSARSNAEASELNVTYAMEDVTSKESALDLSRTTLERNQELLKSNAVSDISVRESRSAFDADAARLAQARTLVTTRRKELETSLSTVLEAEAAITLERATIEAQRALIAEQEQQLLDARSDLDDCVLRAPFSGRITAVLVGEGAVIQAGTAVVTLTMMTPIQVQLTVSAEKESELVLGSDATIFPMTGNSIEYDREIKGNVFEKGGVANEGTRTFTIGLISPNRRRATAASHEALPVTPFLIPVFENPLDVPGEKGLYVIEEAIGQPGEEAYVLRVLEVQAGQRTPSVLKGALTAEQIAVRLGEKTISVASFSLVELADAGGLTPADLLVANPTPAHASGFAVADNRWILRPGDLVQVAMNSKRLTPGFYVPIQAIQELNGAASIFLVREDGSVKQSQVRAIESVGEMRRIEGDGLSEGDEFVLSGAHFLRDGDRVTVTKRVGGGRP